MLGKTNVKVRPNAKKPLIEYVEYIESTGTQYIDTGICPYKTKTEITFQAVSKTNSNQYIIATWNESDNRYYPVCIANGYFKTANRSNTATNLGNYDTNVHTIIYNDESNKVYFDGVEKAKVTDLTTQGTNSIFLFAMHNSSNGAQEYFIGRIMSVKITDKTTNTIIRDLKPCKDGAGVYCMYDEITKRYYYNQGTADFTGGASI